MKKKEEILKRYYQGETSLSEERMLREARQKGEDEDEPMLAYCNKYAELPAELLPRLQTTLHRHRLRRLYSGWATAVSVAAMLILIVTWKDLLPASSSRIQLSDRLKKERFEDALRTIGNVLEEEMPPLQKVVYEDQKLIIAIE